MIFNIQCMCNERDRNTLSVVRAGMNYSMKYCIYIICRNIKPYQCLINVMLVKGVLVYVVEMLIYQKHVFL